MAGAEVQGERKHTADNYGETTRLKYRILLNPSPRLLFTKRIKIIVNLPTRRQVYLTLRHTQVE